MSFVNTVDIIGDEALTSSLIDRSITEIADNLVTNIGAYALNHCTKLTKADFPAAVSLGSNAFRECSALKALILRNTDAVCPLPSYFDLYDTPIKSGSGYIYVPRVLVDSYKAATNWSTYASKFRAIEDYTVDGTTTGALDESKI